MIPQRRRSDLLTIDEMTGGDIADIMTIENVSFPTPWSENMFRKEMRVSMSRNYVARMETQKGKELVGYMNYWVYAGETHLNNIAVRKEHRRKGIASKLMAGMIRRAMAEGVRSGTLEVRKSNAAAIGLYVKFGYVVKGVRPNYYEDAKEDALILWCDFGENTVRTTEHENGL